MKVAWSLDGLSWRSLMRDYERPVAACNDFVRATAPDSKMGDVVWLAEFQPAELSELFPTADDIVESANHWAEHVAAGPGDQLIPETFDRKALQDVLDAIWRGFFGDVLTFQPGLVGSHELYRIGSGFLPVPLTPEEADEELRKAVDWQVPSISEAVE